ncbi:hypothetical protein JHJ32_12825 [Parapedobacter sp. ISTM3]|uniref:Uncharacterized protein n=1 Tax=Parapedobacter luteus TaxID=623280 RepID=A0A1T5DQT0_9SPHI|nr:MULTISPECIES: hypothetical protein [Parapedobacter]MBK1440876.1 hypothetical protein [Parapedobacter sp. ISTM3]SKB74031.1 hypothetical protein SAMN05660226_02910 [Parapedobacter luteus]
MRFLLFALLTPHVAQQEPPLQELLGYRNNKVIPVVIEKQVLTALAHYPELKDTRIRFIFTRKLKSSVMAARPVIGSLFKKRKKRTYDILINPVFKLEHSFETIRQIPDSVLIGWIGHELGHIMDYEGRSTWGLMGFGISYWLSKKYIRKAERVADSFAVNRGMGDYLLATKSFILDHTDLPQAYKDKIAALYLSPDDIVELVAELEKEDEGKKDEILAEEEEVVREAEAELKEHPPTS